MPGVSARQYFPFIKINGTARKTPNGPKYQPHKNHAPLSLSPPGYFLGWFLLVPLRRLLFLRFLVVSRYPCRSVTVNRSSFSASPTPTRFLLLMRILTLLDYNPIRAPCITPFSGFPRPSFPKTSYVMHSICLSPSSPRTPH